MVAVDQLVQVISGFGVVGIDMCDLVIGAAVDTVIEQIHHEKTEQDPRQNPQKVHVLRGIFGVDGPGDQVKTDHGKHDPARKAKQQANHPLGIPLHQRTGNTAQTGAADAGQCGQDYDPKYHRHGFQSSSFLRGIRHIIIHFGEK